MIRGVYYRAKRRMSYHRIPISNEERADQLRTDYRFRSRLQREHHLQDSILEELPINMIKGFPVSDSLHLLDLGIMKRYIFNILYKYIYTYINVCDTFVYVTIGNCVFLERSPLRH